MCFLTASIVSAADPAVVEITTNPERPEPTATITVIAEITGDNIESVTVSVTGCDDNGCYDNYLNLPMTLNDDGKYETEEFTLKHSVPTIDHLQYAFTVNDGVEDHILADTSWKTYLDVGGDNGDINGGTNGSGDSNSPGFELLILLVAVMVGVLVYTKKR